MKTKERPILMSGPMVRAIHAGTKTQTRRVAKDVKHPDLGNLYAPSVLAREPQHVIDRACPYGQPGDRLWVREAWSADAGEVSYKERVGEWIQYFGPDHERSSDLQRMYDRQRGEWRRSIHMPRWASRLKLEIVSVRVERLQDIEADDCACEGLQSTSFMPPLKHGVIDGYLHADDQEAVRRGFQALWESINGVGSWALNPWVWVVEFRRVVPAWRVRSRTRRSASLPVSGGFG